MNSIKMLQQMQGRTALVTGATGGLGVVISETLAELGADIILVDRSEVATAELADRISTTWNVNVSSYVCDLEEEAERIELANRVHADFEFLNCLINCAAFVGTSNLTGWAEKFEEQSLATWRRAFEVNLSAMFHLSQMFTPMLNKSVGSNILNISSIYGESGPDWKLYEGTAMANPAAYSCSKGGVDQLTRWLSTTLAPSIRVNAIAPGGILRGQDKSFIERYEARTPLQRMGNEDDFRGAVAFLASDLSSYVTGQILKVDGGWSVW